MNESQTPGELSRHAIAILQAYREAAEPSVEFEDRLLIQIKAALVAGDLGDEENTDPLTQADRTQVSQGAASVRPSSLTLLVGISAFAAGVVLTIGLRNQMVTASLDSQDGASAMEMLRGAERVQGRTGTLGDSGASCQDGAAGLGRRGRSVAPGQESVRGGDDEDDEVSPAGEPLVDGRFVDGGSSPLSGGDGSPGRREPAAEPRDDSPVGPGGRGGAGPSLFGTGAKGGLPAGPGQSLGRPAPRTPGAGGSKRPSQDRPADPDDRDGPEDAPDSERTCAEVRTSRVAACLDESGLDWRGDPQDELAQEQIVRCRRTVGEPAFAACCAAAPDETCDATLEQPAGEQPPADTDYDCADVLFETYDACLGEEGGEQGDLDGDGTISPDELALVSHCWIEVANGAFDDCCATADNDASCSE